MMDTHKLWLDSLNFYQLQGLTLAQAVEQTHKWPFKYVNGQQTAASVSLENTPQAKPLEGYNLALNELRSNGETNDEALL